MASRGSGARGAGREQESARQSRPSARGKTSAQGQNATGGRQQDTGKQRQTEQRSTRDERAERGESNERSERGQRTGSEGGGAMERERSMQSGRDVGATGSSEQGTPSASRAEGIGSSGRTSVSGRAGTGAHRGSSAGSGVQRSQELGSGMGVSPYGVIHVSPFGLMRRMMEDMDRLLENFGTGRSSSISPWSAGGDIDELSGGRSRGLASGLWAPQIEMFERGNELVVRADLPGLSREDVDVEIEDGVLTISGERRQESEDTREGYYRSERSYGSFVRSVLLPEGVSDDQCNATFRDGVLEVHLPKPRREESRRRRVDIR